MPRFHSWVLGTISFAGVRASDVLPPVLIVCAFLIGVSGTGCAGTDRGTSQGLDFQPERFRPAEYTPDAVEYDTVYTPNSVDTPPTFEGGLMRLVRRMNYPDQAKRTGITGEVWVGFVVAPDGTPRHVQVINPVHPLLDKEAHRLISTSECSPGLLNESPVPVKAAVPITFKLKEHRTVRQP